MLDNNKVLTPDDIKETEELKKELKKIPKDTKIDIIKGIALFEAGYNFGWAECANKQLQTA